METYEISGKRFLDIKKAEIDLQNIVNVESKLYEIRIGKNWRGEPKLFKCFFRTEGEYFSNKLSTINSLIYHRDEFSSVPELVLPNKFVTVDNQLSGFYMDYIPNNINLQNILRHPDIPFKDKKVYLKEISDIVRRTHNIQGLDNSFYLNDIHEANFIYDYNSNIIRVVDIDSCKILNNYPFVSKYMTTDKHIKNNYEKYENKYKKNYNGDFLPSIDTDYLCLTKILNNAIASFDISGLDDSDVLEYLNYVQMEGMPEEYLNVIHNMYSWKSNDNPVDYIDAIPTDKDFSYKRFRDKKYEKTS